jgi:ADP-heptose:LPS heptosyltransferase
MPLFERHLVGRPKGDVKEILCIKLWGLGNLAVIYPLLYRIKEAYPGARVTFITFDINRGFLEENAAVSRVIYFDFTTNIFKLMAQATRLLSQLRREGVDVVIDFETFNNAAAFFSYLLNAPVRLGLDNGCEWKFFTHPVKNDMSKHISDVFLDLLRPLGINRPYQYYYYPIRKKERQKIEALLPQHQVGQFICIHPGTSSNFIGKRYREAYFGELACMMINKYGIPVCFTGAGQEREMIDRIMAALPEGHKAVNTAGLLTIWEFVELLRKSHVFISSDTGPVHLAASLAVNLAVIYGPTTPLRFGPLNKSNSLVFYKDLACSPCVGGDSLNQQCRRKFECLGFSAREVFQRIGEKFSI